jgi:hypothetical protein
MPYLMGGASDSLPIFMGRDMRNNVLFVMMYLMTTMKFYSPHAIIFSTMNASQRTEPSMEHTAQCVDKWYDEIQFTLKSFKI